MRGRARRGLCGSIGAAAGAFALALGLAGCTNVSSLTYGASGPEVRRRFVEEAYCPASRVRVRVVDPTTPAPPRSIREDPERLALWEAAAERRGQRPDVRRVVYANGCGLSAAFECWQDGRRPRRGRRAVDVRQATVCLLTSGSLDVTSADASGESQEERAP